MPIGSYIVGLAGGSASGKTTFITALQQRFSDFELCVMSLDHYYKPLSKQTRDSNGMVNFDHPDGIDFKRVKQDLSKLLKGKPVQIVEYTFNNPEHFPKEIEFKPAPIILLEGLYVFADKALRNKMDWRLFVDVDQSIAYKRRLNRDLLERGMTKEEVEYQWINHVLPSHKAHLTPHLNEVHLKISNESDFEEGLEIVSRHLKQILASGIYYPKNS